MGMLITCDVMHEGNVYVEAKYVIEQTEVSVTVLYLCEEHYRENIREMAEYTIPKDVVYRIYRVVLR